MDDAERRVVRRWKSILAENVIVTSELVQSFKDCGLLTDDKMRQVIVSISKNNHHLDLIAWEFVSVCQDNNI